MRIHALLACLLVPSLAAAQGTVTTIVNTPTRVDAGSPFNITAVVGETGSGPSHPLGGVLFYDGANGLTNGGLVSVAVASPSIVPQSKLLGSIAASAEGTLAVADFNGDGKTDVLSYGATAFQVFLCNSTASSGVVYQALPVQNYALTQPVFMDFNHDGKLDIVSNSGTGLSVFAGNGQGVFAAATVAAGVSPHANAYTTNAPSFTALASADVSGTGEPYLLVGDRMTNGANTDLAVSSYRNNGDGTYSFVGIYPVTGATSVYPNSITSIQTADMNGDGKQDLVVAVRGRFNLQSTVYVLRGYGDGSFGAVMDTLTPGNCNQTCGNISIVVADFDGNFRQDIALTASADSSGSFKDLYVYGGRGDGTFNAPLISSTVGSAISGGQYNGYFASIAAEDVDGDGKLDLVDSMGYAYLGYGNLVFAPTANLAGLTWSVFNGGIAGQILASDFNHDGLQDVYLALPGSTVAKNAAAPSFVLGQTHTMTTKPILLTVGTHSITAKYTGSYTGSGQQYSPSVSAAYQITATGQVATVAAKASPAAALVTQPVTLSVSVTGSTGMPTGTVTFKQGATILGTASLSSTGTASVTYTFGTVGTQSVTASYAGDKYTAPASTTFTAVTVTPFIAKSSDGKLALTTSFGGSTTAALVVNSQNGFSGTVSFACTGLPAGAYCSFKPASVPVSPNTAGNSTLTVTTTGAYASLDGSPFHRGTAGVVCAGVLIGCLGFASRRKRIAAAPLLVAGMAILLGTLSGCGSGLSSEITTVRNFTVVATSGNARSTTPFTIQVKQ